MKKYRCCMCGEILEDDAWSSKFHLGEVKIDGSRRICYLCRSKIKQNQIWYMDYCPDFVSGAELRIVSFGSKSELVEFLKNDTKNGYLCCWDGYDLVLNVSLPENKHFVRGFVSEGCISEGDFPIYRDLKRVFAHPKKHIGLPNIKDLGRMK